MLFPAVFLKFYYLTRLVSEGDDYIEVEQLNLLREMTARVIYKKNLKIIFRWEGGKNIRITQYEKTCIF